MGLIGRIDLGKAGITQKNDEIRTIAAKSQFSLCNASRLFREAIVAKRMGFEDGEVRKKLGAAIEASVEINQSEAMVESILKTYFGTNLDRLGISFTQLQEKNRVKTRPSALLDPAKYNAQLILEIDEAAAMPVSKNKSEFRFPGGAYC